MDLVPTMPGYSQVMLTLVLSSPMAVQFRTKRSPFRAFTGPLVFR